MNQEEITNRVRSLVVALCQNSNLGNDADMFQMGLLSSLYALRLVESIEREFGLTVADQDLKVANFRTIDSIVQLVSRAKGST
jgi:methoxymalonate biosynthesis acyl carrier protein